jgi:hypothetical protein
MGVTELELVEAIKGGGAEPGVDGSGYGAEVVHGEAEAAAGARVGGEDARDESREAIVVVGEVVAEAGEAVAVEVEGGGAPEVAPPGGEDLGAGAVLCGEEGDDVGEDGVREVADAVGGGASFIFGHSVRRFFGVTASLRRNRRRLLQFPLPPTRTPRLHLHRRTVMHSRSS